MPRTIQYLLEQIERAKRFAAIMSDPADRKRFEKVAADYASLTPPLPHRAINSLAPRLRRHHLKR
jgi:hypothetical protein